MRTNPAGVPEKTEHDPRSLIFITQRFDQDKTILDPTAPGDGTSEKVDLQTNRAHRALAVEVANAALFCYVQAK
jgi:hypothetical protein